MKLLDSALILADPGSGWFKREKKKKAVTDLKEEDETEEWV